MENDWQYSGRNGNPFQQDNSTSIAPQQNFYPKNMQRVQGMIQNQALQDNTLDFIPGAKFGSIVSGARATGGIVNRAREIQDFTDLPFGSAMKDASVGMSQRLTNDVFGTNMHRTKPTYREIPLAKDADALGGFFTPQSGMRAGNIYTDSRIGPRSRAVTKRHEHRHAVDQRDNPEMMDSNIRLARTRPGNTRNLEEWASLAAENSAQGREMSYWTNVAKTGKNKGDKFQEFGAMDEINKIRQNTDKYVDNLADIYPKRGQEVLDAMDFTDNYYQKAR